LSISTVARFLPLFTWAHWFELAPHAVGSWRAAGQLRHHGKQEKELSDYKLYVAEP
jgi:hypothetical protein